MKQPLSKKKRILRNLLILLLLAGVMDFLIVDFFLIPENQFRRVERGHMVGPSKILGTEDINHDHCHRLFIAETQEGVILWLYGRDIGRSFFVYREKYAENMLVVARGSAGFVTVTDQLQLPIVLFDQVPRAARAKLDFTLYTTVNSQEFEKSYHLEADRTAAGYFLFTLEAQAENEWGDLGAEGIAINRFACISTDEDKYIPGSVPVQIKFYDLTGQLIETDTVLVRSQAAITEEERQVTP